MSQIELTWTAVKQNFLKYWFLGSALALAVLYYLFDRRGRELTVAHADAQRNLLAQQLITISNQAQRSSYDAQQSQVNYNLLKSRHGDLMAKLGLFTSQSDQTH